MISKIPTSISKRERGFVSGGARMAPISVKYLMVVNLGHVSDILQDS